MKRMRMRERVRRSAVAVSLLGSAGLIAAAMRASNSQPLPSSRKLNDLRKGHFNV